MQRTRVILEIKLVHPDFETASHVVDIERQAPPQHQYDTCCMYMGRAIGEGGRLGLGLGLGFGWAIDECGALGMYG